MKGYLENCFKTHRVRVAPEIKTLKPGQQPSSRHGVNRTVTDKVKENQDKFIDDLYLTGKSFNLFEADGELRETLFSIVTSRGYEQLSIILILFSAILLGMSSPLTDPNGKMSHLMYWLDFLTTIVFIIELIVKAITFGFAFNGEPSYLKNPWNLLDFIIILLSIVSLSPLANKLKIFKMFRILRALRLISRAEGLRIGL